MRCLLLLGLAALACAPPPDPEPSVDPMALLQQAGEAEDDALRYQLLQEANAAFGEDHPLNFELYDLLQTANHWAHGREALWQPGDQERSGEMGYLGGFFIDATFPALMGTPYPPEPEADSPLHPLWALYRGRMLIWSAIQNGVATEAFFEEGRSLLREAQAAYPSNRVIGMYLDSPMDWILPPAGWSEAPDWARWQSQALGQLAVIIDFWIRHRQAPDGQFGGGWGDDVEMWRWWVPLLLGFDHEPWKAAHLKLGEGVFQLERLAGGYSSILTDVEHSGEDTGDTITPALLLDPESATWRRRALRLVDLAEAHWWAENDKGRRQFQSTYFTHERSSNAEGQACDTSYHVRALQPALLTWFQSGDSLLGRKLSDWLRTWALSVSEEGGGKPAGVLPAAIRFPSGNYNLADKDWWDPGCHYSGKTFRYPRALTLMLTALVQASLQSEDPVFDEALDGLAEALRNEAQLEGDEEGQARWAVNRGKGALLKALAKRRILTGDDRYDDLLREQGNPLLQLLAFGGDETGFTNSLLGTVAALSQDGPAYTREVRFTDRVLRFHRAYAEFYRGPQPKVDTKLLYGMLTGDPGDPNVLPLAAVRWATDPSQFAVLVRRNSTEVFEASVVNLSASEKAVQAQLLRLRPGTYQWQSGCGGLGSLVVTGSGGTVAFNLPPQSNCTLRISAE